MLSVHLHGLSLPQQDPDIIEALLSRSSVHPILAIGVNGWRVLILKWLCFLRVEKKRIQTSLSPLNAGNP